MKMTLLGTGTSHGIPCIACDCEVCRSKDRHDKRLRCSAFVTNKNKNGTESHILIDIGPEFRIQALKYKIKNVDAILLTHSHADHLHGLDDIRIFSHTKSSSNLTNPEKGKETEGLGIAIYANKPTIKDVHSRFSYIFKETQLGGGKPKIRLENLQVFEESMPLEFGDLKILPIPMRHGTVKTSGWLLSQDLKDGTKHSIAYLTDCSEIKEKNIEKIIANAGKLEHLVIDGLREATHATHFNFLQAMAVAEKLKPTHTWFIHICHAHSHEQIKQYVAEHLKEFLELNKIVLEGGSVEPAYDGLKLFVKETKKY